MLALRGPITARQAVEWAPTKKQRYPELLRMWGSYDPIESDLLEPKNWVLYGRSVKNAIFWAKNDPKLVLVVTREPAVQRCKHKQVAFLVSSHSDTNNFFVAAQNN